MNRTTLNGQTVSLVLVSIVVSIPACHAGDRGSIPRQGEAAAYHLCARGLMV